MTANVNEVLSLLTSNIDLQIRISTGAYPAFGQFVVTGPAFAPLINRVGYCVQVRRRVGQFGSDIIFLRHADGSLCQHENNCYFLLTDDQVVVARSVFQVLPEDEGEDNTYGDTEGVRETGFLIEKSLSKGGPANPVSVTVMKGVF